MSSEVALRFDRVGKNFRYFASPLDRLREAFSPFGISYHQPVRVLEDITFSIPRGETVAILGANGVGKSVLLHLVAGLVEPSSGDITVNGRVTSLLDLGGSFLPDLTGRENARLFHQIVARRTDDMAARERAIEEFADIGESFDRAVHTYSSGMFLRLAFACATFQDHEILLIDEVLAVGDARFQQKCFRRLREMREGGTTILMVTHLVNGLSSICDRVMVLDNGRLAFDGEPHAGVERYYQLFFMAPELPLSDHSGAELRYGVGGASISNVVASVDGTRRTHTFEAGDRAQITFDIDFTRAIAAPQIGFACTTKEGTRIYATTSGLLGDGPRPAAAGERRHVQVTVSLDVAVGDLFIDTSVFEVVDGAVVVLEARMAVLHLTVNPPPHCLGITDLSATIRVLQSSPVPA